MHTCVSCLPQVFALGVACTGPIRGSSRRWEELPLDILGSHPSRCLSWVLALTGRTRHAHCREQRTCILCEEQRIKFHKHGTSGETSLVAVLLIKHADRRKSFSITVDTARVTSSVTSEEPCYVQLLLAGEDRYCRDRGCSTVSRVAAVQRVISAIITRGRCNCPYIQYTMGGYFLAQAGLALADNAPQTSECNGPVT
jgi:hypothetical protein